MLYEVITDLDGRLVTPPVACGLLAGTYRASLLRRGCLTEQVVTRADLRRSRRLFLINAVRKWQAAILVEPPGDAHD